MLRRLLFTALAIALLTGTSSARENVSDGLGSGTPSYQRLAANCDDATAQVDLDINNVRAKLLGGGDLWWDLNNAKYEVPKTEAGSGEVGASSIFAGALWIGGIDAGSNNLKVAAMTYRQSGNDFWPGPLDRVTGTTTQTVCNDFDRHWKIERSEVDDFIENAPTSPSIIPKAILEWPARLNPYAKGKNGVPLTITQPLAPYEDVDGVDGYDPTKGDYPLFKGDQAIFWVYNDDGNIHTETQGEAIGLEVQALAFGFQTNDQINDMTFYQYKVINYNSDDLDSVYFGQWVDPDLGWYLDDFVGCDTSRSLGIVYNGDAVDGPGGLNYGENPPILGVDFFKGPIKRTYDVSGNVIDSQELGMSSFVFYNNDFTVTGNPQIAQHYYGYLSGTWKDGTPFTYGGTGYGGSTPFPYMFPDPPGGTWSECPSNTPADRRFLQNSGPFLLKPGAVNEVVVGVVWVPGGGQASCNADFQSLLIADDKAQDLFERDFQIANGPDAPDMTIRELDRELILSLSNEESSNNYNEGYAERIGFYDTAITKDTTHIFEGYRIFQLKDPSVSASQLNYENSDVAREIFQVDRKNGVTKIINWTFDEQIGAEKPTLEVLGSDGGIKHSFQVTEDAFASGDKTLINHKSYYFSVLAYAYNNAIPYDPANVNSQRTPYFAGRRNIKVYNGIPHISSPELGGTILNSDFGDGVEVTRVEGLGNGGYSLELTTSTINTILANNIDQTPTYEPNAGPIGVTVYDPFVVPEDNFTLFINGPTGFITSIDGGPDTIHRDSTYWRLVRESTGEEWTSDQVIMNDNEQLIPELGLAITIQGKNTAGMYKGSIAPDTFYYPLEENNGFIEATLDFAQPSIQWLSGVPDGELSSSTNWIRAGTATTPTGSPVQIDDIDDAGEISNPISSRNSDHAGIYEGLLGGTIAPFAMVARPDLAGAAGIATDELDNMPMHDYNANSRQKTSLQRLQSVDIVLTPDNSLWTRVPVVEMEERSTNSEGGKTKMELRAHDSWALNKDVDESTGLPVYDPGLSQGYSWFPGYAINVETGERLYLIFGENSAYDQDNGNDMIWNPTSNFATNFELTFGGMHTVYVVNQRYDEANVEANLGTILSSENTNSALRRVLYGNIQWVSMPMLAPGFNLAPLTDNGGIVPTETKIRLRVTTPYQRYVVTNENQGLPKYTFSTKGISVEHNVAEEAVSACDLMRVVPNPYYAYSNYEKSKLDNRIRITNLPANAEIKIYTVDGQLIKTIGRDVAEINSSNPADQSFISDGGATGDDVANQATYVEWNLTNSKNVPVSSGMYLIHIQAEGICDRVLKFMAITRPVDLDTF